MADGSFDNVIVGTPTGGVLRFDGTGSGASGQLAIYRTAGNRLQFQGGSAGYVLRNHANTTNLVVVTESGKMGIGVDPDADPSSVRLESAGVPAGATADYIRKSVVGNSQIGLNIRRSGSGHDVDTYLYAGASGTSFRIWHGGADRVVVAANGKVGIGTGTTEPQWMLDVRSPTGSGLLLLAASEANPAHPPRMGVGMVNTHVGSSTALVQVQTDGDPFPSLALQPFLGKVGIGTGMDAPQTTLDVRSPTGSGLLQLSASQVNPAHPPRMSVWMVNTHVGSSTASVQVQTDGNPFPNLALQPFIGNVGIGTSMPAAKLDVAGGLKVSGQTTLNGRTYTWPSIGESAGYVLTTNGGGLLSWAPAAATGTNYWGRDTGGSLYPLNLADRVGVGTIPGAGVMLEVRGGEAVFGSGQNTHGISFREFASNTTVRQVLAFDSSNTLVMGNANVTGILTAFGWTFRTGVGTGQDRMVIDQNGNVGIGKSNPGARFDVNGNINASGAIVAAGNVNSGIDVNVGNNVTVENDVWAKGAIHAGSGKRKVADSSGCYYA